MIKSILLWLLEMVAEEVTHKTGERASVSGLYRSGDEIIPLSKGETFPNTPLVDNKFWKLVVSA